MLDYILFNEELFQIFIDWLKEKDVAYEVNIDEDNYVIKVSENLADDLLDNIDDKYDELMDMNQDLINEEEIKDDALTNVEQHGIVFLDEMDKIAKRGETSGADVSREGVQRDLLPLVEVSTVSTKYGMVKTDNILFIA